MEFQSRKVYLLGLIQKPLNSKYKEQTNKNAYLHSLIHIMSQKQFDGPSLLFLVFNKKPILF